jgi:hypothetical protein
VNDSAMMRSVLATCGIYESKDFKYREGFYVAP